MVTAEAALVLPVLVVLLTVGLGAVTAVTAQLRCVDAAREAARAASRGEPTSTATGLAMQAAPAGASVVIDATSDRITVTVRAEVPLAAGLLPAVAVEGTAVALPEPTAVPGGADPP